MISLFQKRKRFFVFAASLTLISSPFAFAEEEIVHLLGPEVTKLSWNTRAMASSDIDGDGLSDIVLINNDQAKIEILYQRKPGETKKKKRIHRENRWDPVLEDSRFDRESVVTGTSMYDLAIGDFNNDGRSDIAYTSKADSLTIFFQGEDEGFVKKEHYKHFEALPWSSTILASDYNEDGLTDIVLLSKESVVLYPQSKKEGLTEPIELWLTKENIFGLEVIDFNGDGLLDIQYLASGDKRSWRVRLQDDLRAFGPEQSYPLQLAAGGIDYLKTTDEGVQFAYIQAKTRLIEILKLAPVEASEEIEDELSPKIYATASSGTATTAYVMDDFNGDGSKDMALTDPNESRIWIYQQNKHGLWNNAIDYPSLKDISSIASGRFGEGESRSIALLSSTEKILGVSTFNEEGRLLFPQAVTVEGNPEVFTVADIDAEPDAVDEILLVESRKRDFYFNILKKSAETGKFEVHDSLKIDDLKRAPKALQVGDFNQDGAPDLMLLIARDASRFYSRNEEGEWVQIAEKSPMRKSLLDDIDASRLGRGDVDGDGKDELLVANKGFIRALRINSEGELVVVEQFNTRRSDDDVHIPMLVDFDQDGQTDVALYVKNDESIQLLKKDELGQYRYDTSYQVGPIDPVASFFIEGQHKHKKASKRKHGARAQKREPSYMLVLGQDTFWALPLQPEGKVLEVESSYETDLENVFYNSIHVADLNNDDLEELILIDGKNHVLEVLRYKEDDATWKSALHFTIFNENLHYSGRKGAPLEPREVLIGDFTGDGAQDIVLLIHDRLLLYPQGQ